MFKNSKYYLTLFFIVIIQSEAPQYNCDCSKKIEEFFDKVSSKDIANVLIAEKKAEIIKAVINASQQSSSTPHSANRSQDAIKKEGYSFQPKFPTPLTFDELKKSARERIKEKFIGVLPELVDDLISYFSDHKKFLENKIVISNRLLLVGEPGNGKTYLAHVLAQELQVPLLSFSAADFADKYIGEASKKIHEAFELAKNYNKPFLIFIDEIDALASKRADHMHDENRKTLTKLLTELQEAYDNKNIFIIFATNDLGAIDRAFLSRVSGKSLAAISPIYDDRIRAQYFSKLFKDHGIPQDDVLAQRLADVAGCTYYGNSGTSRCFSCRDLKNIVAEARFAQFKECNDSKICDKHLCSYLRKSIDRIAAQNGQRAWYVPQDTSWFGTGKKATYCDGI